MGTHPHPSPQRKQGKSRACTQKSGSDSLARASGLYWKGPVAVIAPRSHLVEHRDRLEGLAFEHLKRRTAAGRDMAHPVGIAQLLDRRG